MSVFLTILTFMAILIALIIIHELGHFITAKRSKVKVEELGLGFPPRIFGIKKGETLYSINLIPLGGFCRMAGEDDPDVQEGLGQKSVKTRLLVLSAGSVFMLLFPLILLPIAYMIPMERPVEDGGVWTTKVLEGTPAEAAGVEVGDLLLRIDGREIKTYEDMEIATTPNLGEEVTLLLGRKMPDIQVPVMLEVSLIPREEYPEGQGPMGIQTAYVTESKAYPPWEAIPKGIGEYGTIMVQLKDAWGSLFSGEVGLRNAFAGPIGIAQLTGEVSERGADALIRLVVIISVSLAIVNLLPIPGLDGGRIVFVAIEGLRRGKRLAPKREGQIHLIGFVLLIMLFVLVSYNDIVRLINGEGFLS